VAEKRRTVVALRTPENNGRKIILASRTSSAAAQPVATDLLSYNEVYCLGLTSCGGFYSV